MTFPASYLDKSTVIMNSINKDLSKEFKTLVKFYLYSPASIPKAPNNIKAFSEDHLTRLAQKFSTGRAIKPPTPPSTIPDSMVSIILQYYFDIKSSELEKISKEHSLSMGAENIVGDLLERYIASVIENKGWVWCTGSTVKAGDFIKEISNEKWIVLQIKNRDNSENSSSSAIRDGTDIKKWFRTFSRRNETNWDAFPDDNLKQYLSEESFKKYVIVYLDELKKNYQTK